MDHLDSRCVISDAFVAACRDTRVKVAAITPATKAVTIAQNESASQTDTDHTDYISRSLWFTLIAIATMWTLLAIFLFIEITARRKRQQLKSKESREIIE